MTLGTRQRRLIGLGGAGLVAVVVAVVVVVFGIAAYPDLPRLADQPEPVVPGQLAYVRYEPDGTCAYVADGDGTEHEIRCLTDGADIRWDDRGRLELLHYRGAAVSVDVVDPDSGQVLSTYTESPDRPVPGEPGRGSSLRGDGARLDAEVEGTTVRVVVVDDAGRHVLWETSGPAGYRLEEPTWSPSGDWALVRDSRSRLIVLRVDGDPVPRIWLEDVWQADWYEPGA